MDSTFFILLFIMIIAFAGYKFIDKMEKHKSEWLAKPKCRLCGSAKLLKNICQKCNFDQNQVGN